MNATPLMTPEAIRAWKARLDRVSARIEREQAETPHDPVRNREIAGALAVSAWARGWCPQHDPERAAEKIRILKLLHGSSDHPAASAAGGNTRCCWRSLHGDGRTKRPRSG